MGIRNAYVRAAIEFAHDIAAGAFPGAVLAAWLIRRHFETSMPAALRDLEQATTSLWLVLLGTLAVLVLTGGYRLGVWQLNLRKESVDTKRRGIVIKHVAFVVLLIVSIVALFGLVPH